MFVDAVKAGLLPAVDNLFLLPTSVVKRRRTASAQNGTPVPTPDSCHIEQAAVVLDDQKPFLAGRVALHLALQTTPSFGIPLALGTADNAGAISLARNALHYLKTRGRWAFASHPIWAGTKVFQTGVHAGQYHTTLFIHIPLCSCCGFP